MKFFTNLRNWLRWPHKDKDQQNTVFMSTETLQGYTLPEGEVIRFWGKCQNCEQYRRAREDAQGYEVIPKTPPNIIFKKCIEHT